MKREMMRGSIVDEPQGNSYFLLEIPSVNLNMLYRNIKLGHDSVKIRL
jgi:hypothetical protein